MIDRPTNRVANGPIPGDFVEQIRLNLHRMIEGGLTNEHVALIAAMSSFFPGVFAAICDRKGTWLWLSPGFSSGTGYASADFLGRTMAERFSEMWCRERLALIARSHEERRAFATVEILSGRRLEAAVLPILEPSGAAYAAFVGRFGLAVQLDAEGGRRIDQNDPCLELVRLVEADWGRLATLTRRELEVLRFVAMGMDNVHIAKAIHRTKRAVEWHICNLYHALGCTLRTDLYRIGLFAGLPDIEESHWLRMLEGVHDGRDREYEKREQTTPSAAADRHGVAEHRGGPGSGRG